MSTTSATSTTTSSLPSSTPNTTSSSSSVLSDSVSPSSEITRTVTTSSTTVSSTMSTVTSISSLSPTTTSSAMPSSTSSLSISSLSISSLSISSAPTTSEPSSSPRTTSPSSISTIPSFTPSSTSPSSTSSSTTTQDPSTTSQTTSSQTPEPTTTSSSTPPSSSVPSPTSTSSTFEPTSVATTSITPTTTHISTKGPSTSASGVLTETTITSIFTTTSNGQVVTVTKVSVSQTLSPNKSNSKDDSFFQNTGAVAGVFVVVGLAIASIFLWILFALRRRRRTRRLEHDTAVSATLAAAGFHRTPLDDDEENENVNGSRRSRFGSPEVEMQNRASSGFASTLPSGARTSAYFDSSQPDDPDAFNPYREYVVDTSAAASGTNPPFSALFNGPYRDRTSSGGDHTHEHSASGSYEPLLASYYRQEQAVSSPALPTATSPPNPPPRNPLRLSDAGRSPPLGVLSKTLPDIAPVEANSRTVDSCVSSESMGDERLDPGLRQRMNEETDRASQRDPKDEEDYSRPVLGVRNLPNASEASQEA